MGPETCHEPPGLAPGLSVRRPGLRHVQPPGTRYVMEHCYERKLRSIALAGGGGSVAGFDRLELLESPHREGNSPPLLASGG